MLQGILAQCCFPQLSFLSANVRELIRIDFLTALPPEISFKILCCLDTTSLCKAAQVSQRWRSLADDDVVWHRMCEQHIDRKCTKCGWGLPLLERKLLRATKRQTQLRATGRGLNEWSPDITPMPSPKPEDFVSSQRSQSTSAEDGYGASASDSHLLPSGDHLTLPLVPSKRPLPTPSSSGHEDDYFSRKTLYRRPWKDVYKDRFKVGTNWKYGRCTTKIFKGHTNGVMCLQFDDNILVTGSYDATIKIWDINTGREIRTLHGHQSGIRCIQFDDTKLISGSMDRTVKVWNWRTGECLKTFPGHRGGVITLHFDSNILATGSVDKTVKIWNFKDNSTFRLPGHTDWVNAVKIDSPSRTFFSASDDCTIRLWDLDTQTTIRSYEGHVGQVQQVLPLPHEFEFEENDASLADDSSSTTSQDVPSTPPITDTNNTTWPFGYDRPPPPRYMLTSALDSTIRLWEVSTGRCLRTFFGHVEGVWALAADTLRVVTGAEDRMVKVWDPRTGKCERTFTGHAGPVTCVGLSDSRMCTGSEDCEVRMYSFKDAEEGAVL
jgi:F-box and WD-40 domain protein MET30